MRAFVVVALHASVLATSGQANSTLPSRTLQEDATQEQSSALPTAELMQTRKNGSATPLSSVTTESLISSELTKDFTGDGEKILSPEMMAAEVHSAASVIASNEMHSTPLQESRSVTPEVSPTPDGSPLAAANDQSASPAASVPPPPNNSMIESTLEEQAAAQVLISKQDVPIVQDLSQGDSQSLVEISVSSNPRELADPPVLDPITSQANESISHRVEEENATATSPAAEDVSEAELVAALERLPDFLPTIPYGLLTQAVWNQNSSADTPLKQADQIAYLASTLAYTAGFLCPKSASPSLGQSAAQPESSAKQKDIVQKPPVRPVPITNVPLRLVSSLISQLRIPTPGSVIEGLTMFSSPFLDLTRRLWPGASLTRRRRLQAVGESFLKSIQHGAKETQKFLRSVDFNSTIVDQVWFQSGSLFLSSLPTREQDRLMSTLAMLDTDTNAERFSALLAAQPYAARYPAAALLLYRIHRALVSSQPPPTDSSQPPPTEHTQLVAATNVLISPNFLPAQEYKPLSPTGAPAQQVPAPGPLIPALATIPMQILLPIPALHMLVASLDPQTLKSFTDPLRTSVFRSAKGPSAPVKAAADKPNDQLQRSPPPGGGSALGT